MVAKLRQGVRSTELNVAASRVAQGVHALRVFPVTKAKVFARGSAAVLVSLSRAMVCRTGDAVGGEWPNWGFEAGVGRGETCSPSGILDPRRAEGGGGDERIWVFREGAGAADATNPLRATVRWSKREGTFPVRAVFWLRVSRVQGAKWCHTGRKLRRRGRVLL